ncbi:hypothetical protein CAPTEDRAFT_224151 [Capitella teleta]|uniref:EGF-like domain-containing protein n=1 Tax=Capitella teleta TaxID=283909 RepID=R7V2I5_CAPTE|nr:hypothetical protein CAPTEDRAFT_224151 [Capitella teleta]|eukprot:ELU09921.1 hypothetical protein CAPTEDRAFT_224151 [Capitella teleta]
MKSFILLTVALLNIAEARYYYASSASNHVAQAPATSTVTCAIGVTYSYIADPDDPCRFFICENGVLVGGDSWQCPSTSSYLSHVLSHGVNSPCSSCSLVVVTSTAAATSTTTSASPIPTTVSTKAVVSINSGKKIEGGVQQTGISHISDCIVMCKASATCQGFDYYTSTNACWFHMESSICNALIDDADAVHFSFFACASFGVTDTIKAATDADIPTTANRLGETGGGEPYIVTFLGMHISGGTLMSSYRDALSCIQACQGISTCLGVDFNTEFTSCWFHYEATACNAFIAKARCTHYRLSTRCGTSSTFTTVSTAAPLETSTGFHIRGGTLMSAYRDVAACLDACRAVPTICQAVDFNSQYNSCWFHSSLTACDTLVAKATCTNYRLAVCAVTSPTAATTSATTIAPREVSTGFHILGGTLMAAYRDATACLDACRAVPTLCLAVDFNTQFNSCWFHTSETACAALVAKATCTNYRFTICASTTVTTPTTATTATTTVTTPTTTVPSTTIPAGFISTTTGSHIPGGFYAAATVTESQCLDLCLMNSYCLAVDYNSADRTCFFHDTTTYCNAIVTLANVNHYKRVPCMAGITNPAVEVRLMFYVLGGTQLCTGCSLETCLTTCYSMTTCQGIDFDSRDNSCYLHTSTTVCNPLVPKSFCQHITTVPCTPTTSTATTVATTPAVTTPAVITAPTGTFTFIRYPGPTVLPTGFLAYPGMQVDNGILTGGQMMTGDECVTLCQNDATCVSVDFNSGDGTCWFHTTATQCDPLNAVNEVYHMQKAPQCATHPAPLASA